jgi:hypothetical protein
MAATMSFLYVCKRIGIILTCFGGNINNPCPPPGLNLDASQRRRASEAINALDDFLYDFTIVDLKAWCTEGYNGLWEVVAG